MDLVELTRTLPNGLHDAEVTNLSISYEERILRLHVHVWIGDMDAPRKSREEYRAATIELRDLEYCIFDRPDPNYLNRSHTNLTIDLAASDPSAEMPGRGTACRLWVAEWNGFIHLRGREATLTWTAPSIVRAPGV
jgi:hypothetical protein